MEDTSDRKITGRRFQVSNGMSVENVNKTPIDLAAKLPFDALTFNALATKCARCSIYESVSRYSINI